tara:strand:+ start:337 stop:1197 length:861 start_codon:yes stop_codon:yes gene_type:complete
MNFNRNFKEQDLNLLNNDGVILLKNFVSKKKIKLISDEIQPWLKKITFNNTLSSSIIGNNQWISHLGLASEHAVKLALDLKLTSFIEKYFGEKIILAECSYQKKILPEKKDIPWHSDRENGIYVFVFLNNVSNQNGSTTFIKKSHIIDEDNNYKVGDGAKYITDEAIKNQSGEIIQVNGEAGTILIFSQNIWHKLPSFKKPGREVLWFKYFPERIRYFAVNHLYKQSVLSKLTKDQLAIYCVGEKINFKKGITQLGSNTFESGEHKISNFRMLLYYLRFYLISLFR